MTLLPPRSTLFPYTTLFRSSGTVSISPSTCPRPFRWDWQANDPIVSKRACIRLQGVARTGDVVVLDRKSTRLNSSHVRISYAVFCLNKTTAQDLLGDALGLVDRDFDFHDAATAALDTLSLHDALPI